MTREKPRAMITGAALGFITLAAAIRLTIDAPRLATLHFNHAQTTGHIIRVIPNGHGLTEIAYSVGGTAYKRDVPSYWLPDSDVRPELLRVYFSPRDRSIASAVPADEILSGQLPSWIAGSALGAVFGAIAARNIARYLG